MANDLTFQQLQDAIGSAGAISYDATEGIRIKIAAITGDTYTGLTSTGVIEALSKLLAAAYKAQVTVNASAPIGARLNAFSQPALGIPTGDANGNYYTVATYTMQSQSPIDLNSVVGPLV
jgi:hypothetical protein